MRLAQVLGCAPPDIIVYAVEGFQSDAGVPVTAGGDGGRGRVAGRVIAEVGTLLQSRSEAVLHA